MTKIKSVYFDMDGTIADLYGVKDWLPKLIASDPSPYEQATPLVRMSALARRLNNLQKRGFKIGIVSWLSKNSTPEYDKAVTNAKLNWLKNHLPSVCFDDVSIVPYGTPKSTAVKYTGGVLFDDEERNRLEWIGIAFDVNDIGGTLSAL